VEIYRQIAAVRIANAFDQQTDINDVKKEKKEARAQDIWSYMVLSASLLQSLIHR
jgi:hypothetical protein